MHTMFVRDIGFPPKHWMMMERMVVARRKLEGGKLPLQIARDLGFLSETAFRRQFQKYYQMRPEKFIKRRRFFKPPIGE